MAPRDNRLPPVAVPGSSGIAQVFGGFQNSFAIATDGRVYAWGANYGGPLGDGTEVDRTSPLFLAEAGGVWRAAVPKFSKQSDTYFQTFTVHVTTVTPGGTIRYTTNGSEPTETDPIVPAGGIPIEQSLTLQAKTFKTGMPASAADTAVYILKGTPPNISPGTGTYTSAQSVSMTTTTPGAEIRYTLDGTDPQVTSTLYTSPFSLATKTTIKARAFKTGWQTSDARTEIHTYNYGNLTAPTMSPAGGTYPTEQTVTLNGPAGAVIRYTTDGGNVSESSPIYSSPITVGTVGATTTLRARAYRQDWTTSGTTAEIYNFKAGTPQFSVTSGAHTPGQLVSITSATPSATIRYTINGSTPTATSPILPSGATLTLGNYTLKAIAVRTPYTTSDAATAVYSLTGDLTPPRIAAGYDYSAAVRTDGTAWAAGRNNVGQIGDGTGTNRTTPVIVTLTGVESLSANEGHTLAVTLDGNVHAWGNNTYGQLGDGTSNTQRSTPGLVSGLTDVVAVAAGLSHSLALTSGGQVWSWGRNNNGQIGDGGTSTRLTPYQVPGLSDVAGIAAGEYYSVAWTNAGAVWVWGANNFGQLGDGTQNERRNPTLLTNISGVTSVAAGRQHTLAVTSTGALYAWGLNTSGQVGDNTTTMRLAPVLISTVTSVARVAAGYTHSLAVTQSGALYVWGANASYQVGDGTTTNRLVPTLLSNLPVIADVAGGHSHSIALDSSGSLWTWGYNLYGQIGNGTQTTQQTPTPISDGGLNWGVSRPTFSPAPGTFSSAQQVTLSTVTPGATIRFTLDGTAPTSSSTLYSAPISIDTGTTISAKAFKTGLADSATATGVYVFDYGTLSTPTASPAPGTYPIPIEVTLSGPAGATLRYTTDNTTPTASSTIYTAPLAIVATTTVQARAFKTDWTPSEPLIAAYTISNNQSPTAANDAATTKEDTPVSVPVLANDSDPDTDTLTIAGVTQGTKGSVSIGAGNVTYAPSANANGADSFTYTISDGHGHTAIATVAVTITPVNDAPIVTVQATPNDGEGPLTVQFLAEASDVDSPTLTYAWTFGDGQTAATASATHLYAAAGTYAARVTVSDGTTSVPGNVVVSVRQAGQGEAPPPNPTTTATPTDPGVATNFGDSTQFLYTGAAPVQRGVTAGAIDPKRTAVIRGRVFDQAGTPLPGARVTIAGQSAFGYTLTRADGMFDLAVNGGGVVVVRLAKDGYLSSQRRVETRWQDYSWMDNVRLVPLDPVINTVGFHASAPAASQIARGSAVSDVDGTRQPTLIVPDGGSNATIHLPDGTVLPAQSTLNIRATDTPSATASPGASRCRAICRRRARTRMRWS